MKTRNARVSKPQLLCQHCLQTLETITWSIPSNQLTDLLSIWFLSDLNSHSKHCLSPQLLFLLVAISLLTESPSNSPDYTVLIPLHRPIPSQSAPLPWLHPDLDYRNATHINDYNLLLVTPRKVKFKLFLSDRVMPTDPYWPWTH